MPKLPNLEPAATVGLEERLIEAGFLTPQQLQQANDVQQRTNAFLGQVVVDLGFVASNVVGQMLARDLHVGYIDLIADPPEEDAVNLIREDLVRSARAIPVRVREDRIEVAMTDPLDVGTIDRINLATGLRVVPLLTMAGELQRAINDHFDASSKTVAALSELETQATGVDRDRLSRAELAAASEAPIVRLVDSIIESALAVRASDIHFEPHERSLRVRFRIDGTLIEQTEIPRSQMNAVIARLKVLCVMDITESRRPQDGRMRYDSYGRAFDIRASSVPAVYGEKLVLRILDKSSVLVPLARLGFYDEQRKIFQSLIRQPHGMVIVVGPTGSGKSTTLYSALNILNDATRNIMTLEDPVEYNVVGLNQIQVNTRIGLTFASGLRTFVRQDPDVILVGEIRDRETAEMAVQASLTGHLMLSTLHTNSAVGTVPRLVNLGVDPFLIAQALAGVVSQRLVARVCPNCGIEYKPEPEVLEAIGVSQEEADGISFKRGRGCRTCFGRGYQGRIGVFEVMVIDDDLRRLIMRQASEEELADTAIRNGMVTLRDGALTLVKKGITTAQEMGRVVLTKGI